MDSNEPPKSSGSVIGRPPVRTIASPPTRDDMPSVDMNDGTPKPTVTRPLMAPTRPPSTSVSVTASQGSIPHFAIATPVMTAQNPYVGPDERSNSPTIIRYVSGRPIMIVKALVRRISYRFLVDVKCSALKAKNRKSATATSAKAD